MGESYKFCRNTFTNMLTRNHKHP